MAPKFSAFEDEKLIEEVRKYSAIYDPEQRDYKNLTIKDAIWEKIGVLLEKNGRYLLKFFLFIAFNLDYY